MVVAYQEIRETLRRQPALEDLSHRRVPECHPQGCARHVELGSFLRRATFRTADCCSSFATSTRASLKHAPAPRSVSVSGTSALPVAWFHVLFLHKPSAATPDRVGPPADGQKRTEPRRDR